MSRIEEFLDNSADGFAAYDSEFRATLVNPAVEQMCGMAADRLIGRTPWEVFPQTSELEHEFRSALTDDAPRTFSFHCPNRDTWAEITVVPGPSDEVFAWFRDITERTRVENSLRESEERYRSIVTAMAEGVVFQERDGTITWCNARAERILGLTKDQMQGRTSVGPRWRAVHEDGTPFPSETHPAMVTLRTGKPLLGVIMGVHRPDDSQVWISINSEPLFREREALPYAVVTTFADITEQRRADEDGRKAKANLTALVESTSDLIWSVDLEGRLLAYNQAAARYVTEILGGRIYLGAEPGAYIPTERLRDLTEAYARTLATGSHRNEFVLRTGRIMEFIYNRIVDGDRVIGVSVFGKDITERRHAQKALLESERRLSLALDAASDGVFDWKMDTGNAYFSPRYYTMLGYAPDEFRPSIEIFRELLDPEDKLALDEVLRQYAEDGRESHNLECRLKTKEGDWRWILTRGRVVRRDAAGKPVHMIGTHVDITERKRSEEALREAHEILNSYLEHSPLAVIEWDSDYRVTRWSGEAERIFGWTAPEVLGRRFDEIPWVPGEDLAGVAAVANELRTGSSGSYISRNRNVRKDGTVIHCEWVNTAIVDADGRMVALSQVQDVSERVRLREEVERQQLSAEYSRDIIFHISDGDFRILQANPAAVAAYGYTREELCSKTVHDLRAGFRPPLTPEQLDEMRERGLLFQSVHRRRDGSTFPVEVSAQSTTIGGTRTVVAVIRDITARKRAADELQHSEERYRRLVELGPDTILVHDGERILFANPAAVKLFGAESVEDLIGLTPYALLEPESMEVAQARIRTLCETGGSMPLADEKLRRLDGSTLEAEVVSIGFRMQGRNCVQAVIRDVSERNRTEREKRALEAQLQQSQKLESIGRLAGGVAHDFNNLLTVINGYSELLVNRLSPGEPSRDWAVEILKAGERAASLTRQMLAFGRKQVVNPQPLNLNRLIAENQDMLQRLVGDDIQINTRLDPDLGVTMADSGQLHQVLMNLSANSRYAMPKGGLLTISTANVDGDQACTAGHPGIEPGPYVLLTVSDTGTGMPKDIQERIFDPFFTTKPIGQGSGLGLSTVYGIVQQSGGAIYVRSEPGRGAAFDIWLPRIPTGMDTVDSAQTASAPATQTILVVEDQDPVRTVVATTLANAGYRVLEAASGQDALAAAQNCPNTIHLLLVDMIMPGMTGRELAEQMTRNRPETKVLYMSGYAADVMDSRGLRQGASFLQKPFAPDVLTARVREILGSRARQPSPPRSVS